MAKVIIENVATEIESLLNYVSSTINITAVRHGVCDKEIANELYHIVFGEINEQLVKKRIVKAPDFVQGEGRYLKCIELYAAWKNSRSAHVFIAEKENGIVRYVDPQPNKDDVEYYFSLAKRNHFGILRVDDKDITTDSAILGATVRW